MDNWELVNINGIVTKTHSTLFSFIDNKQNIHVLSADIEKQHINVYVNGEFFKCIKSNDEKFGHAVVRENNNVYIASNSFIYIYNVNYELINKINISDKILSFDVSNDKLFIKDNNCTHVLLNDTKTIISENKSNKLVSTFVNNIYHIAELATDKTKITIFSSNDCIAWTKCKEYKFSGAEHMYFEYDCVLNKLWLIVCDKLNLKMFQCNVVEKKWNHFYSILHHNEVALKKSIAKCDNGGKFWVVCSDVSNKIHVFEKDENKLELTKIKTIKTNNDFEFNILIDGLMDMNIILENLIGVDCFKIQKFYDNEQLSEKYIEKYKTTQCDFDKLNISINLKNNNNIEKQFSKYYETLINFINDGINNGKNKDDIQNYKALLKKFVDSYFVEKKAYENMFLIYKYKKNAIIITNNEITQNDIKYDIPKNVLCYQIIDNKLYANIITGSKVAQKIIQYNDDYLKIDKYSTVYNLSDNGVKLFFDETNHVINKVSYYELALCDNRQTSQFQLMNPKTMSNNDNTTCLVKIITFGYVPYDNLLMYPCDVNDEVVCDKVKYLTINFGGINYFVNGIPSENVKLNSIENVTLMLKNNHTNQRNEKDVHKILSDILTGKLKMSNAITTEIFSTMKNNDDQLSWKSIDNEQLEFDFLNFDMMFYNKTKSKILMTFDISMFFETIGFTLDPKCIIYGKVFNDKIVVEHLLTQTNYVQNDLCKLYDTGKICNDANDDIPCFCKNTLDYLMSTNSNFNGIIIQTNRKKKMIKFYIGENGPYLFTDDHPFYLNNSVISVEELIKTNNDIINVEHDIECDVVYNVAKSLDMNQNMVSFYGFNMIGASVSNELWKMCDVGKFNKPTKIEIN